MKCVSGQLELIHLVWPTNIHGKVKGRALCRVHSSCLVYTKQLVFPRYNPLLPSDWADQSNPVLCICMLHCAGQ